MRTTVCFYRDKRLLVEVHVDDHHVDKRTCLKLKEGLDRSKCPHLQLSTAAKRSSECWDRSHGWMDVRVPDCRSRRPGFNSRRYQLFDGLLEGKSIDPGLENGD
jgi:hypothetical protein